MVGSYRRPSAANCLQEVVPSWHSTNYWSSEVGALRVRWSESHGVVGNNTPNHAPRHTQMLVKIGDTDESPTGPSVIIGESFSAATLAR